MSRRRTPGRPQLRQRCASGEKDSEDEDSFWVRKFDDRVRRVFGEASAEDEVLAMPRLGISLTPDDAAREEDLLEVFAREAVMFELFECVDREAICAEPRRHSTSVVARRKYLPRTPRPRARRSYSALRSSERFPPCFRRFMSF